MLNKKMIDKTIPVPLYYQLKTAILDEIKCGEYSPGSMIPTEVELSELFDISRTTVRQAITDLVKEGKLYRIKSKGTFVTKPKVEWDAVNRTPSFSAQCLASGRTPHIKVLLKEVIDIPKEFENNEYHFQGNKVIHLYRVRYADSDPIVTQHTYVDYEKAAYILNVDFEKQRLMQVLETHPKTKIVNVYRTCEATLAGKEDTELLNVKRGSAILKFDTFNFNADDELVEYTISRYRADEGKMHIAFSI